ncbi:MAG: hypothetical protein DRI99_08750 [Candidatus Aminicenantes bacterium]|nr:MAG: hypothetical protein DRI99_08750 [Candidatus Aminicenantes bacterium]
MQEKVKSGRELLDEFFTAITDIEGVEKEVAIVVGNLYREGKLTDTNLSNELDSLRRKWLDED